MGPGNWLFEPCPMARRTMPHHVRDTEGRHSGVPEFRGLVWLLLKLIGRFVCGKATYATSASFGHQLLSVVLGRVVLCSLPGSPASMAGGITPAEVSAPRARVIELQVQVQPNNYWRVSTNKDSRIYFMYLPPRAKGLGNAPRLELCQLSHTVTTSSPKVSLNCYTLKQAKKSMLK